MKRAIAAALILVPGAALAQSYQTALPLSPRERVALEARLSTILDYKGAGEAAVIELPTGRIASVRTYQVVRNGGAPCRGYRIDLAGRGSRTAVDGFRCRHPSGPWVIAEPETVVAQEAVSGGQDEIVVLQDGGPLDLRGGLFGNDVAVVIPDGTSRDLSLPQRLPEEPLYPGDDGSFGAPAPVFPPPVPRPAPRRDATADAPSVDASDSALAAGESVADPRDDEGTAVLGTDVAAAASGDEPAETIATPSGEVDGTAGETRVAAAGGGATGVIVPTTGVARLVGGVRDESSAPPYASDERVMNALQDLDYLDPTATPTPEAVDAAVDEFARDERFALPISADGLVERLASALDRSETLASCGPEDGSTVCRAR